MATQKIEEYRPGRNFIRVGDMVRVKPSKPRRHDGYEARVRAILADDDGNVRGVEVRNPFNMGVYTLRPDRIERVAQSRRKGVWG